MLPRYVVLQKPRGATPLETVSLWRERAGVPESVPTSYAGRLDPMAEGKLLVLVGDECKRQKEYTKLDKEYEVEVLLGIGSDTGDVLGIPTIGNEVSPSRDELRAALHKEQGTHERSYPVYSSKTVNGKPLFLYALEGTLDTIAIPTHEETIYAIKLMEAGSYTGRALDALVSEHLALAPKSDEPSKLLGADFRIGAIAPAWKELLRENADRVFPTLTIRVTSKSGVYMRTLAERVGASLGTQALALSITRTRIGKYQPVPLIGGFWSQDYS